MKTIAIIPARAGSKRIPNKNIKEFLGKPIIAYAIETALNSEIFDEVIVSTNSNEIANIAIKYGAKVPFLRSEETSDDFATTAEVLTEVVSKLESNGNNYEYICCLYPTAVLINSNHLVNAKIKFISNKYDTLISTLKFGYPIQRGLRNENGTLHMLWPENKNTRSQDLEPIYYDAGQFYFFNVEKFKLQKQLFTSNTGHLLLSAYEAQDIDNPEDWTMAEIKYKFLNKERLGN
ncbi:MAG: pseudaminic acid cytidylyltransferase [Bacteroidetes bacterium]|nr:pseudaminic acid cytidylyltransferase [Bacteroidota bacterium]